MQAANLVWVTDVKLFVWAETCHYTAVQIVNHFGYFIYFVVDGWELLLLSKATDLLHDTCLFHTYLLYIHITDIIPYIHFVWNCKEMTSKPCEEKEREKNDSYWGIMRHHWHLQNIFIELYSLSGELLPFLAPNQTAAD